MSIAGRVYDFNLLTGNRNAQQIEWNDTKWLKEKNLQYALLR